MSRHRDVRNMDYSEDYDGYDDVYGHSIDDDYYISPSNRQFIFNRENSRDQPKIGEFIRTEQDIQEEDETELAPDLTDVEKAKLESCIEQIKSTLSPLTIPRNELVNIIISHNFDPEQATNAILDDPKNSQNERKEKDVANSASKFSIPELNGLKETFKSPVANKQPIKRFNIPSLSKLTSGENSPVTKNFKIPKICNFVREKNEIATDKSSKFDNLSDLVSSHLTKSFKNNLSIDSTVQVDKIVNNIDSLKITKETPSVNLSSSNYQIDLSVALKSSPSVQSLPNRSKHDLKEEKFEIPFIDCDTDLETKTILKSSFDVKDILNIYLHNVKPVSNFGKVLCRNYRRRCRIKIKRHAVKAKFNFTTPSPDDSIIKHLKTCS
jgi:elongation factor 1 alpha-like protein